MTFHRRPGSSIWNVAFRLRGEQIQLSTGTADYEQAIIKGAELLLMKAGRFIGVPPIASEPSANPQSAATDCGIEAVIGLYRRWLESPRAKNERKRPRAHTAQVYINRLRQLANLTQSSLVSDLRAKAPTLTAGRLGVTEENFVPLLRGAACIFSERACAFFASQGFALSNPLDGYIPDVIKPEPFSPPSREFVQHLMAAARAELKSKSPGVYLLIYLALVAGLRQQEAAHVRERDILPSGLRVYSGSDYANKTGRYRDVPLAEASLVELREFCTGNPNAWLVPDITEATKPAANGVAVQRAWREARRAAVWLKRHGVTSRHPLHWLRKCFASFVTEKHGLFVASRWLGHASVLQTEKVYAGIGADKRPDAF